MRASNLCVWNAGTQVAACSGRRWWVSEERRRICADVSRSWDGSVTAALEGLGGGGADKLERDWEDDSMSGWKVDSI